MANEKKFEFKGDKFKTSDTTQREGYSTGSRTFVFDIPKGTKEVEIKELKTVFILANAGVIKLEKNQYVYVNEYLKSR